MQQQRIHKYYKNVVSEDLLILYNYSNIMQLPTLQCAVVSYTDSNLVLNKKQGVYDFAANLLTTGQKSIPTRAHKSIAAFKLRAGSFMGCKVTLRRDPLYTLLDLLYTFVFTSTQNYGINVTNVKNSIKHSQVESLNVGIHKVLLLPQLERFFLFFDFVKGCNVSLIFSCPILKESNSHKIQNNNTFMDLEGINKDNQLFSPFGVNTPDPLGLNANGTVSDLSKQMGQQIGSNAMQIQTKSKSNISLYKILLTAFQIPMSQS